MLAGAGLLLAALAGMLDGWTSGLAICMIAGCTIQGLRLGAIELAGLFLGTLLSLLLAGPIGRSIEDGISGLCGTHGLVNCALSIGIVGIGIVAIAGVAGRLILRAITPEQSAWRKRNSLAGAILGFFEGLALALALMWIVLAIQPIAAARLASTTAPDAATRESYQRRREAISQAVVDLAKQLRGTAFGGLADHTNPLPGARIFALAQAFAEVSRDPYAMHHLLASDAITQIRRLESYNIALTLANRDNELMHFFTDEGVEAITLQALVSNDTILRIMDETTIVKDIEPHAEALQQAIYAARDQIGKVPAELPEPPVIDEPTPGER